jgi:hypothetical protein
LTQANEKDTANVRKEQSIELRANFVRGEGRERVEAHARDCHGTGLEGEK